MHFHNNDKLKCPYKGCEKHFDKPALLTDASTFPRTTHYACPYCMSKIDILTDNMRIVEIKPADYPMVFDSPVKCAHYFGFLNMLPKDVALPDECLVCPKVLQCGMKKH